MRRQLGGTDISTFEDEVSYILHRPEIFIGSTQKVTENGLDFIPALNKLFDEIISNSVDEGIRTNFKFANKIVVTYQNTELDGPIVTVSDNGRGIPQAKDKKTGKYIPELVFTNLRTGSNFDDTKESELLGKNGVGVSLTNIFSNTFSIDTCDGKKTYFQTYQKNSKRILPPTIKKSTGQKQGTTIIFYPDVKQFKGITKSVIRDWEILIQLRIKELAVVFPEIKFNFNGNKIHYKKLSDYFENPIAVSESEKCRLAIKQSYGDLKHQSFVNGVSTRKGGTHVEYTILCLIEALRETLNKKHKINIKPSDIRNKLDIIISLKFPNPIFDSQSKEQLTTTIDVFKGRIDNVLTDKFLNTILKDEQFVQSIIELYELRKEKKERGELKKAKKSKKIIKLIEARSKDKSNNILMICEGDCLREDILIKVVGGDLLIDKSIKDVNIGDHVLTHNHNFKKIINKSNKIKQQVLISTKYGEISSSKSHRWFVYDITKCEFDLVASKDLDKKRHKLIKNRLSQIDRLERIISIEKIHHEKYDLRIHTSTGILNTTNSHKFGIYDQYARKFDMKKAKHLIVGGFIVLYIE